MKRKTRIDTLAPAIAAGIGVLALIVWNVSGSFRHLEARVPGMDRTGSDSAIDEAVKIEGTLIPGDGVPAELPGSWPRFRGERGDGMGHEDVPLARVWSPEGPPVLWTAEVGEGYAGPAVRDGRVYLVDYDHARGADAIRCLSLADGREIWRYTYPIKVKRNHGMSRTVPTVTDTALLAMGPKCHVTCLDPKNGTLRWMLDLVRDFGTKVPQWYAGQCPLVEKDRVILAPGGKALLMAVNIADGTVVWETPNPRRWGMTHGSIAPMTVGETRLYVYCATKGVVGVAADDGRLLWETTEWKISIATVPTPVPVDAERVFLSGGYNAGSLMLGMRETDDAWSVEPRFRLRARVFGATQHTPILLDDHLYGMRPDGQFVCLDLEGRPVWESGRKHKFGSGRGPFLVAGDLLYVMDEEGHLTLAEATPSGFKPLAQAEVLPDGNVSEGPMAIAGGRLLVRDFSRLVCLDVKEK